MLKKSDPINKTTSSNLKFERFGKYDGEYENEACSIFSDDELPQNENSWFDLMKDDEGNVYAVFGEDSLTCPDAEVYYYEVELEPNDYPLDVLIKVIKMYSSEYYGEEFINSIKDELTDILNRIASETNFTAVELIKSVQQGF